MKNNLNNLLILNIPTFSLKTTRKTQYKLCSGKSEKRTPSFLDFWASFSRLRMLLLHDNGIGRLSCVQALSFAPSIEFLTLFDTPLSIRPSYRHHVVNSITTLKGHKSIKLAGFSLGEGMIFLKVEIDFSSSAKHFKDSVIPKFTVQPGKT